MTRKTRAQSTSHEGFKSQEEKGPEGIVSSIITELKKTIITAIVTAVVGLSVYYFTSAREFFQDYFDSKIAEAVDRAVGKKDSELIKGLTAALLDERSSAYSKRIHQEIDAEIDDRMSKKSNNVNTGLIYLNSGKTSDTIDIYAPKKYTTVLYIKVESLDKGQHVLLLTASGQTLKFDKVGVFTEKLDVLLAAKPDLQASLIKDAISDDAMQPERPDEGYFDNLFSLTFQLKDSAEQASRKQNVAIRFISTNTPDMQREEH